MSNPESFLAQEFLYNEEIIKHRTAQRARVLACLACRWANSEVNGTPQAYGYEIIKCSGTKSGVLYPMLKQLEEGGVIGAEYEDIDTSKEERPKRKYLVPVQTELGRAFQDSLEVPAQCQLEQ